MFKFLISLCVAAIMLASQLLSAQGNGTTAEKLSNKEKEVVLNSLFTELNAHYIYPEKAELVQKKITRNLKQGQYKKINSPAAFADTLTAQVKAILKDRHFGMFYQAPQMQQQPDSAQQANRALNWQRYINRMNLGFPEAKILDGNIGYLKIEGFGPPEMVGKTCSAAITFLSHTDAMIIDLRQNQGGEPAMVQYVASHFFTEKPVHLNILYYRDTNETKEYWSLEELPGERYSDKPVYILTSASTFSAAEELAYDLQILKRATIVGEVTGGGANDGQVYPIEGGFGAYIPRGRAINPITRTNWDGIGIKPDVIISSEEALTSAHKIALQELLDQTADEEGKNYYEENLQKLATK